MGSSFHYGITAGFRAVSAWQQNIMRNATGLLTPGYNRQTMRFGSMPGQTLAGGQVGTASSGGRGSVYGGGDTLALHSTSIHFEAGDIEPAFNPTSLAIKGSGFFVVAENLNPGARLFLTRNGDFHYDTQGRLVNSQGLFVVGGNGTITDPPTPVRNPGDGSVVLPELTLGRVPSPSQLETSGYGALIYQVSVTSGAIQGLANGRPEVGFVQSSSLEMPRRAGMTQALLVETSQAQQTYKLFKDMLESFNRSTDDAIGVVR